MKRMGFNALAGAFALHVVLVLQVMLVLQTNLSAERLPIGTPDSAGMDTERLKGIEQLVLDGIQDGKMPGAVVCVGHRGKIVYLEAFGNRQVGDDPQPMTTETVFDMASITKPVATATSVMKLVEDGHLQLGSKVIDFFPEFAPYGKDEITIQDMLVHQSGLIPDNALADYLDGPELAWKRICDLKLVAPVGQEFKYSDVNFIVLAKVIEKVSGKNVDEYSQENIFTPLGMSESGYNPREELKQRTAPTEKRGEQWMRGEVHDPRAFELGGVAGHAGLFSTAQDLAIYAQMMLEEGESQHREIQRGEIQGDKVKQGDQRVRILSPATVRKMTSAYRVSRGSRGLGWDKQSPYSSNRGDLLSPSAFGHGGFTGTVLWIDPELDLFFIFLSNRVHPSGKGSVNQLAGQILNVVASSIVGDTLSVAREVQAGIDVLESQNFRSLANQRVGLITNHTGRSMDGRSTAEILKSAPAVTLAALFSPEHGFEGKLDVSKIGDSEDAKTGIQVFSLYGETRRPTPEMLAEVDTLVFDIQDIGARFYTYISTMGEAMEAAAAAKKRFVVLDRPNPLGGLVVTGPMLDPGKESFVGYHRLPVRHGMTIGEIAQLLKSERKLDIDLDVVCCEGWRRQDVWDATGLTWINPSPNMRCLTQAFLYPGVGLLETTNVSVGRGTDTPFEVLGAPWINGQDLSRMLNARHIPGVRFVPIEFTPNASQFKDKACGGINIVLTDRSALEPVRVGLEIATCLRHLYPDDWETKNLDRLLCNSAVYESIVSGASIESTLARSMDDVSEFRSKRQPYLLYE